MSERRALGVFTRLVAYYGVLAGIAWLGAQWIPRGGVFFAARAPAFLRVDQEVFEKR